MHELELSPPQRSAVVDALVRQTTLYFANGKRKGTRASYASDQRAWDAFLVRYSLPAALPASIEVACLYVAHCAAEAGNSLSTIKRRVASLCYTHRQAGDADWPAALRKSHVFREVLAGIMRVHGAAQVGATPLSIEDMRRIVAACPANLLGRRNRSLFLLGFSLGSRRSELPSAIEIADLTFSAEGVAVRLSRSKTDQFGVEEHVLAVPFGEHEPTCPVRALQCWLKAAGLSGGSGPVFHAVDRWGHVSPTALHPRSIAKILEAAVKRAHLGKHVSPHSLRSGFCTTAAVVGGCGERQIARTTGHRSTVLRRYIRDVNLFGDSASGRLGL